MRFPRLCLALVFPMLTLGLLSCSGAKGGSKPTVGVTLTVAPHAVHPGDVLTATVVFDEDVTGMTADDLQIAGGTAGVFAAVDARTYTLSITSAGSGATTVDVDLLPRAATTGNGRKSRAGRTQAAIAYAPWADGNTGTDAFGVWADLTVSGNGETAVQRFRLIPPGTFLMGSPTDEVGHMAVRESNDLPETQHQVTLTTPYWIADSECTQRMWKAVTNSNPSWRTDDGLDLPVESIHWHAVQTFIADLNTSTIGLSARLPTEAEWEYAARAGTVTPFSIDVSSTDAINCAPAAPYVSGTWRTRTIPVKSLPANPWGLHDVHGNVYEWCWDAVREDLGAAPVVDPVVPPNDDPMRIIRDGHFLMSAVRCRAAARTTSSSTYGSAGTGFRMVIPNGPIGSG